MTFMDAETSRRNRPVTPVGPPDAALAMAVSSAGYAITAPILSERECDALVATLAGDGLTGRPRAGRRHLMDQPGVAELATDRRLVRLASAVLGGAAIPFKATLFEKSPQANWAVTWQQDTVVPLASAPQGEGWGPASRKEGVSYAQAPSWVLRRIVALRVHLDAATPDNGPLRVIPGSHRRGVLGADAIGTMARTAKVEVCLAPRGAVLLMTPLLIHASSKAGRPLPRRVLHFEYAEAMEVGPGTWLARA